MQWIFGPRFEYRQSELPPCWLRNGLKRAVLHFTFLLYKKWLYTTYENTLSDFPHNAGTLHLFHHPLTKLTAVQLPTAGAVVHASERDDCLLCMLRYAATELSKQQFSHLEQKHGSDACALLMESAHHRSRTGCCYWLPSSWQPSGYPLRFGGSPSAVERSPHPQAAPLNTRTGSLTAVRCFSGEHTLAFTCIRTQYLRSSVSRYTDTLVPVKSIT